jgi:hypothetical protein
MRVGVGRGSDGRVRGTRERYLNRGDRFRSLSRSFINGREASRREHRRRTQPLGYKQSKSEQRCTTPKPQPRGLARLAARLSRSLHSLLAVLTAACFALATARRFAPLAAGGSAAGDCPFESRPAPLRNRTSRLPSLAARSGLPPVARVARGVPRACTSRPPPAAARRHAPPRHYL